MSWKENIALDAETLGLEKQAAEAMADYEQRAADLGPSRDTTVSALRFVEGTIRAYSPVSFV